MLACLLGIANPGSYSDELNKILKLNNLPQITAPSNPPSNKILATVQNPETLEDEKDSKKDSSDSGICVEKPELSKKDIRHKKEVRKSSNKKR